MAGNVPDSKKIRMNRRFTNPLLCMTSMKKSSPFILSPTTAAVWSAIESLANFTRRGNFKEKVGGTHMLHVRVKGKRRTVFIIENSQYMYYIM